MRTGRLEAFSDGVLAIIITIMVLELATPEEPTLAALAHEWVGFLTYALSFVYVGIYWNNHHHLFQLVDHVSGPLLWANLHLLFWLSLFPFTTRWMDETRFAVTPTVVYGIVLMLAGSAFTLVERAALRTPSGARLRQALGGNGKEVVSVGIYVAGIALTFLTPLLGVAMFVLSALLWLLPDRRVERFLAASSDPA